MNFDSSTYQSLVDLFEKWESKDVDSGLDKLSNEMASNGFKSNSLAFLLINRYSLLENEADWEKAILLLNKANLKGIRPPLMIFNSLIDMCSRMKDGETALLILKQILEQLKEDGYKQESLSFIYTNLILLSVKLNKKDDVISIYNDMKTNLVIPNVITHLTLANFFTKWNMVEELSILKDSRSSLSQKESDKE
jgi:pentatricopeptide repeat protein